MSLASETINLNTNADATRAEDRRVRAALLYPVILTGGHGTRLWPVSRNQMPKQLLPLTSSRSMLQETLLRLADLPLMGDPVMVCNAEHRFVVAEQLREIDVQPHTLLLEQVGRGTAPAVAAAALRLMASDPEAMLLVLPADHVIAHVAKFHKAVSHARRLMRDGYLSTFGVVPTSAETGFGYIQRGKPFTRATKAGVQTYAAGICEVARFVEKPDAATAESYVRSGDYFWNSGMFLFSARAYLDELTRFAPDIVIACQAALDGARQDLDFLRLEQDAFLRCPSDSVDHAVMENTDRAVMVPVDIGWNDVGSWSALWEYQDKDASCNAVRGQVILEDVQNSYVYAEKRLVAALGVKDLVIVETADAILVASKDRAQDVRRVVDRLQAEGRTEHEVHQKVYRPWGSFEGIDVGQRFQVKRIIVTPGARLSLQMHHHRSEHWVVVSGTAEVTIGSKVQLVGENESVYIPLGELHSLANPGRIPLHLIEVQSGPYLGEDDVVRLEDQYGRLEEAVSAADGQ